MSGPGAAILVLRWRAYRGKCQRSTHEQVAVALAMSERIVAMAQVHRRTLTIEWGHCDPAGLVVTSRVFEYFDWSTALLFEALLGMTKKELQATYDADIPLVDVKVKVIAPCCFGDVLEIETRI